MKTYDASENDGIARFIARFCPQPDILASVLSRSARRLIDVRDGEILCCAGDAAHELWIIHTGRFRIEAGSLVNERGAGEFIGEQAFFRVGQNGQLDNTRGATIRAAQDSSVYRIDKVFIDEMNEAERAIWHETCARALSSKLDEATSQRHQLRQQGLNTELMFRRFVAEEGQAAARAAFASGDFRKFIETEKCEAVVWFSDVKGFSEYAKTRPADTVGNMIREIMDIQAAAIATAHGQIDKFMGDGLMAFWKAADKERLETAVEQSVIAAVECARNLDTFFRASKLDCDIRIGIHSGPVIFGDFGGSDRIAFTMIGDTVNIASRYEQAKLCTKNESLGRIRVSEVTFQMLSNPDIISLFEPESRLLPAKHQMFFPARIAHV